MRGTLPLLIALAAGCTTSDDTKHHYLDAATAVDATPAVAPGIYVTNPGGAILVFASDATGDVAPIRTITGPSTKLSVPIGLAVDGQGQLYVANRTGSAVTVYAPTASGDAAPIRTITATGMGSPETLALGPAGDLFVATCPGCGTAAGGIAGVFHVPAGASTSDTSLTGPTTGMTFPSLAGDPGGELVVANSFGGVVGTFAAGATGDAAPLRSFQPAGSQNIQGAVAGGGLIALASPADGIDVYDAAATGAATPLVTLAPSATLPLKYPGGMYLDLTAGQPVIYLVDYTGNAVYVITTTGSGAQLAVGSVRTIAGPTTGIASPVAVTVVR